jgi:predicted double-glycine peptidase
MKGVTILLAGTLAGSAHGAAHGADLALVGGAFHVPVRSMQALRFASTLHQQYDFSCGSAALATLLTHHYGFPVAERTVFAAMWARGDQDKIRREGFSLLDMQRYLADHGFQADGFRLPLDKLAEAGLPAIVLITEKGYNHFVVIKGFDAGRVLLGDPSSGTRSLPLAQFEAAWPTRLLFVIHAAPGEPRFNLADDWRAAPHAPLADAVARTAPGGVDLPKFGPGDF